MTRVLFEATSDERAIMIEIVWRAEQIKIADGDDDYDLLSARMDLEAVHCNGNPLDLDKLFKADEFTFVHDVFGIQCHINRENGRLDNYFVPRCSA